MNGYAVHLGARQRVRSAGAADGGMEVEEQAQIVRAAVNLEVPGAYPARAACSHKNTAAKLNMNRTVSRDDEDAVTCTTGLVRSSTQQ